MLTRVDIELFTTAMTDENLLYSVVVRLHSRTITPGMKSVQGKIFSTLLDTAGSPYFFKKNNPVGELLIILKRGFDGQRVHSGLTVETKNYSRDTTHPRRLAHTMIYILASSLILESSKLTDSSLC